MKIRSALAVLSMTVALTACGELPFLKSTEAPAAPEAPATHAGPPAVSPLEQPIETGSENVPVAMAEASTLGTAMFRAVGAGWTVTAADKTAVYERSGQKSVGVTVRRMTYAKGVEFIGTMNGSVFSLNVRAQSCEAGGSTAPFTARLKVGGQTLTGCATPTDSMPKAQVKASSATPKPKATAKPAATKPVAPASKPAAASTTTTAPATSTAPATTIPASPTTSPTPATETPATTTPVITAPANPAPETPAAIPAPLNEPAAPAAVLPPAAAAATQPAASSTAPAETAPASTGASQ
ncbi:hypothetical protein GL279_08225 [Paracoccus limosus]|uniref:Uncharacterized protein n=1 Tax=Paracoccus limosus TaxID=913252 RepID=A0A844H4U4_9RHOB|nr:hypothetical protein [Paracoccus limosus]MTH34584.1 hypothetical protein [Paracoccus limosus]